MNASSRITAILFVALVIGSSARQAGAQDDPVKEGDKKDDTTTTATLAPLVWEPMITEFYVFAEHGTGAVVTPPTKEATIGRDARGEASQWRALVPLIAPRSTTYGDDEPVFSAWQRWVNPSSGAVYFLTFASNPIEGAEAPPTGAGQPEGGAGGEKPPPSVHTLVTTDHVIQMSFDCDILMNREPAEKDKLLKDFFQMVTLTVDAVKVSDDPKRFRDAVPIEAKPINVFRIGDAKSVIGPEYLTVAHNRSRQFGMTASFDLLTKQMDQGVWELRILQRVAGKATSDGQLTFKEAQGAIRVALVKQGIGDIRKLSYESVGRTRRFKRVQKQPQQQQQTP